MNNLRILVEFRDTDRRGSMVRVCYVQLHLRKTQKLKSSTTNRLILPVTIRRPCNPQYLLLDVAARRSMNGEAARGRLANASRHSRAAKRQPSRFIDDRSEVPQTHLSSHVGYQREARRASAVIAPNSISQQVAGSGTAAVPASEPPPEPSIMPKLDFHVL